MKIRLMKKTAIIILSAALTVSCTTQKKLAYLGNLDDSEKGEYFTMEVPDYKVQHRDILYVTIKGMDSDGMITDFLSASRGGAGVNLMQSEPGQFLYGFDVDSDGNIILPVVGPVKVAGETLEQIRMKLQLKTTAVYQNALVECKLLSFKFTVLGEVKIPGSYINYNNYLTVLEAIGRAGGIGDYGKRSRIIVVRPQETGTHTYMVNLQDKKILSSPAYFIMPNDVIIVEPEKSKIFNMNLPQISFIVTSVTSTITMFILLFRYTGGN